MQSENTFIPRVVAKLLKLNQLTSEKQKDFVRRERNSVFYYFHL